jgi:glycosyltransferase 2 family protein
MLSSTFFHHRILLRSFFSIVVLCAILLVLHSAFPLQDIVSAIATFPKKSLIAAIILALMVSLIKTFRFGLLLHTHRIVIPPRDIVKLFFASQAASALPAGETLRGWLVHKESGQDPQNAVSPVLFQIIFELSGAIILVLVGSAIIEDDFLFAAIAAALFLILLVAAVHYERTILRFLKKIPFIKAHTTELTRTLRLIRFELHHHSTRWFIGNVLLAIFSHTVLGLILFIVAQGFHLSLSIPFAIFIAAASVLLQTIGGFMPGGIGITEGGMTGILMSQGFASATVFPTVLVFRMVTLGLFIILGICVFSIFYGKMFFTKASPNTLPPLPHA